MPSVDFSLSFGPIEDKRFALRPRSKDQKELPFSIIFVCVSLFCLLKNVFYC